LIVDDQGSGCAHAPPTRACTASPPVRPVGLPGPGPQAYSEIHGVEPDPASPSCGRCEHRAGRPVEAPGGADGGTDMVIDRPAAPPLARAAAAPTRAPLRWAAVICGLCFLAVGLAGFFPGVAVNLDAIELGYGSGALVLGIFQVSVLHNVLHLLLGAAALAQS